MSTFTEPSASTSDTLLGRVRARDAEAWPRFASIYAPLVYHWARRGGLQPSDAEDIVQDVFRTVFGKIDDFQKDGQASRFRGWLWAITRNRVRLHFRERAGEAQAPGGSSAALALANLPELWQHDEEPATADERRLLVKRALAAVQGDFAEATWKAFWRVVLEGQSPAAVADDLDLSPAAVRQAKYRVLCRLRAELAEF